MSDIVSIETSLENSELEESFETQEDPNGKSDIERGESPTQKSEVEPSKPKRRGRRGKKRKQRKDSSAACENESHEAGETNDWKSDDEDLDPKLQVKDTLMLRPINVPKAPENYNTFIMDEHDECHLYKSFETPNPHAPEAEAEINRNCEYLDPFQDAAYMDVDFEYESPLDFDIPYYDREFEESYKNNRFDSLIRKSREELIAGIELLESRLRELSGDLVKENPSPVLEKLQAELLELQEKNLELKECHSKLKQLVMDSEAGSAPGESPANSQTLTDGFSPQSDLVSPSHTIELSRCEQSPRKGWSPYSPVDERRSRGETPDIEDESALFSKLSDILKVDSSDVNSNTESAVSARDGECCISQNSDVVANSLNRSEDGEAQSVRQHSESGDEADRSTFNSELIRSPNSMSPLEELNSLAV